jgi:hypothetical protein
MELLFPAMRWINLPANLLGIEICFYAGQALVLSQQRMRT